MQSQQRDKVIRVMNAVAAGTTDQTSSAVDMTGFESVEFVAMFGALTATQVTKLKAQSSKDDGAADAYADLEGTLTASLADGDSNKCARLEIVKPRERYLKCIVDRGTANAVIDGMIAILRKAHREPVTQDASVAVNKSVVSPAEGTA
jgi:hypothetical protein